MAQLSEFLEDNAGGLSVMRLSMLIWVVGVLVAWIVASIQNKDKGLAEIPAGVLTIIGILVTGKTVQRFGENSDTATISTKNTIEQSIKVPGGSDQQTVPAALAVPTAPALETPQVTVADAPAVITARRMPLAPSPLPPAPATTPAR